MKKVLVYFVECEEVIVTDSFTADRQPGSEQKHIVGDGDTLVGIPQMPVDFIFECEGGYIGIDAKLKALLEAPIKRMAKEEKDLEVRSVIDYFMRGPWWLRVYRAIFGMY